MYSRLIFRARSGHAVWSCACGCDVNAVAPTYTKPPVFVDGHGGHKGEQYPRYEEGDSVARHWDENDVTPTVALEEKIAAPPLSVDTPEIDLDFDYSELDLRWTSDPYGKL